MALPISAVFDENGNYVVSGEAAARLSAQLGHVPELGEQVVLALVEDGMFPQDDPGIEQWIRAEVIPAYEALRADPSRAISSTAMRAELADLHAERSAAQQ